MEDRERGKLLLIRPAEPGGRENARLLSVLSKALYGIACREVTGVKELEAVLGAGAEQEENWEEKEKKEEQEKRETKEKREAKERKETKEEKKGRGNREEEREEGDSARGERGAALPAVCSRRVLFAVDLGSTGINLEYIRLLEWLRLHPDAFDGWVGGVVTDADSDLYTKSAARELVFAANSSGCAFVGRPLVEGTKNLTNFTIVAANLGTDLYGAYVESVKTLAGQLINYGKNGNVGGWQQAVPGAEPAEHPAVVNPFGAKAGEREKTGEKEKTGEREKTGEKEMAGKGKNGSGTERALARASRLLVLHASSHKNSNTYAVWSRVKELLPGISVTELGLRNGTLSDCSGCPYRMCLHFGEKGSCFYGGVMVEAVYPAVREADGILLLAPNYNDALSANLTAFINRLTALFRTTRFYDKKLFGIVVSGYSGGDLIAEQMIAALNMNKTFHLPGHFAMLETANQAGEAMKQPGIEERIRQFAQVIRQNLTENR